MNVERSLLSIAFAVCLFFASTVLLASAHAETPDAAVVAEALALGVGAPEALATEAVKYQDGLVYLIGLIAAALGAAATWVSNKLFGVKGKIPLPAESRAAIENAVHAGIKLTADYLQRHASSMPDWQTRNVMIARVANFVAASAPTALAALGITATDLDKMIREKLDAQEEWHPDA